jgi:hypothetical protein
MRPLFALLALCTASAFAAPLTPAQKSTLDRISADSLRGHLSFIASDLLEGRKSPSRGLDLAAEYLAAQYRRAGLEPVGDDGYFQTANWIYTEPDLAGFKMQLQVGAQRLSLSPRQVGFAPGAGIDGQGVGVIKVVGDDLAPLELMGAAVAGKVVVLDLPSVRPTSLEQYEAMQAAREALKARLAKLHPLAVLALDRKRPSGNGGGAGELVDPEKPKGSTLVFLSIHGEDAARLYDSLAAGASGATADLHLASAISKPVRLRNVAALLRGSDPVLKNSYVILSAHYDHLGMAPGTDGDTIYNGANDDGSGTVSVIEIAGALAASKERPKRSILFLNLFGEELGMLGSTYYGKHPLVPLARTVADLNLEQLGRTDASDGDMRGRAAVTGYRYSTLPATLAAAGKLTGLDVYEDEKVGNKYFEQSDNAALARQGIPAHTLSVAYEFPDYHKVSDHWQKIDYDNMARVDRTVALGLLMLANDKSVPAWNKAEAATAPFVKAAAALVK